MISVEIGLSVALIELFAGFVVGNALHLDVPGWPLSAPSPGFS
jgi:hypothetical protein